MRVARALVKPEALQGKDPSTCVFTPMPRSGNSKASHDQGAHPYPCRRLAQVMAEVSGGQFGELVERSSPIEPNSHSLRAQRGSLSAIVQPTGRASTIVLVDDVMTSGASLYAAAEALRQEADYLFVDIIAVTMAYTAELRDDQLHQNTSHELSKPTRNRDRPTRKSLRPG